MNTILITGTSRGLGKALKEAFERRGDRVVGYQRSEMGDIRDPLTIWKLQELAQQTKVNILVNNAGVYFYGPIDEMIDAEIRQTIEINLLAPILLTKALWPLLRTQHGTVININSVAGRFASNREVTYSASKHGLTGFSRALLYDGARDGVRVIDIPFTAFKTDMTSDRKKNLVESSVVANLILQIFGSADSSKIKDGLLNGEILDNRCFTEALSRRIQ